jgi:hypothetical protein
VEALLVAGSEKAAAYRFGLSHSTVKHHLANARSKVGAETTAQLVWILGPRLPEPDDMAQSAESSQVTSPGSDDAARDGTVEMVNNSSPVLAIRRAARLQMQAPPRGSLPIVHLHCELPPETDGHGTAAPSWRGGRDPGFLRS